MKRALTIEEINFLSRIHVWKKGAKIFVPLKKGLPVLALDDFDLALTKAVTRKE